MTLPDEFAKLFPQPSPELLARLAALDSLPLLVANTSADLHDLENAVAAFGDLTGPRGPAGADGAPGPQGEPGTPADTAKLEAENAALNARFDNLVATGDADFRVLSARIDDLRRDVARLDEQLNPDPPPTPVGPSGFPMPTTDPAGMTRVFADDFTAYPNVPVGQFPAATNGRWSGYPNNYVDTSKNGHYNLGKTCSIVDGVLDIHLWSEMVNGVQVNYSSAPYPLIPGNQPTGIINGVDFTGQPVRGNIYYGEVEYAFRCAKVGAGRKTAWLLWPDKGTNTKDAAGNPGGYGEIDFVEGPLTGTISGYHHRDGATIGGDQDVRNTGVRYDTLEWHIAKTRWEPNLCEFYFDGKKVGATITSRVDKMPMHFLLQSECYPLSGGPQPPLDSDAHLQIDWIVIRQLDGIYP